MKQEKRKRNNYFKFAVFYEIYKDYYTEFGTSPKRTEKYGEYPIGDKIQDIKRGKIHLNAEEKIMLEQINPEFFHVKKADYPFEFEEFYAEYKMYYDEYGCGPTKREPIESGYPIGNKVAFIKCGRIKITPEQKKLLLKLDPTFFDDKSHKYNFEEFFANLEMFYEKFGRIPKTNEIYGDYKVGQKLGSIRQGLIKTTDEQKERLLKIDPTIFDKKQRTKKQSDQKNSIEKPVFDEKQSVEFLLILEKHLVELDDQINMQIEELLVSGADIDRIIDILPLDIVQKILEELSTDNSFGNNNSKE